ncbi:MAG: alkylhydroperoxidase, partial [Rhodoplanes sp.]
MDERTKKSTGGKRASAAHDPEASREPATALNLPRAELSPAMEAYFKKCDEKIGFVPNVLEAYAFDMAKL